MYSAFFKRLFDLILSFFALMLLAPLFIFLLIGLLIANKGKVFFIQDRPGLNEKVFKLIKFKTMNDKKDSMGNLLPDKDRITRVGKFIRSTSLDEIPQLINVVKGDMSLIGPRPLLVKYLPHYNEFQKKRHDVKPGITGWAQINGRNNTSWDKRFELDVFYVENVSLTLDIKILISTLKKVFFREDINSSEAGTMQPFK